MLPPRSLKIIAIIMPLLTVVYGLFIAFIGLPILPKLIIVPRDYGSIQEAIDSAFAGDIIYVEAGIYRETLLINKPLMLIGEDPLRTLIDGGGGDYAVMVEGENVLITGFTITGGGEMLGVAGRGAGLQIYNSSHILVHGNHFTGNRMAIYVHSSSNILISGNLIYNNREGVYLTGSNGITITGNTITENQQFGIHLTSSRRNTIIRNTVMGGMKGIYLYSGADENEISENMVKGGGMIILDSSSNTITNNVFAGDGIFVSGSYANTILGNEVNGEPIIYLEGASGEIIERAGQVILVGCENITIRGVRISGVGVGMELWMTNNSRIIESELAENEIAVYIHSSRGNELSNNTLTSNSIGLLISSSHDNAVLDNIFASNLFGIALRDSGENTISNNMISGSLNAGMLLLNSSRNALSENIFTSNSKDVISLSP